MALALHVCLCGTSHSQAGSRWCGQSRQSHDAIQLIRTQIIGRCCCIIPPSVVARPCAHITSHSVPRRYAHLSLVQRRQPPAQQTVSRYVLCLICFGNTDHIIVIVQSCAAQEAAEGVAGAPPLLHGVKGRGEKGGVTIKQGNGGYRVENSRGAPRWSTALNFAAPRLKPLNSMWVLTHSTLFRNTGAAPAMNAPGLCFRCGSSLGMALD